MSKKPEYPLEQVALIKKRKLEEAEKLLREKKLALEKEEEKLRSLEKERDEVKEHRTAKLEQLREKMDEGTSTTKIEEMRNYLKTVDEKLKIKEQKVTEQQKHVTAAEREVEIARQDFLKKQQEVEKIKLHRKDWEAEVKTLAEKKESLETDEMGSVLHVRKRRSGPKK